jgi:hypothetical protein
MRALPLFLLAFGLASVSATYSFSADAKPPKASTKPRPTATSAPLAIADAGETEVVVSTTSASPEAGATASETTPAAVSDGGKLSPLTPPPAEFARAIDAGTPTVDYDRVLSDIAALRARVAAATDLMFRSKIHVQVKAEGKYAKTSRFTVALDDGVVYAAKPGLKLDDWTTVYEHAVAPGRHAVTIDVERADQRDEGFRSSQKSRLVVEVPKDQKLNVEILLIDDSTMGGDFPSDRSGRYDLHVRMRAAAKESR